MSVANLFGQSPTLPVSSTTEGSRFYNGTTLCSVSYPVNGTVHANTVATILTTTIDNNTTATISIILSVNCLTGANTGLSDIIYDFKVYKNNVGTVFTYVGNNSLNSEVNLTGTYSGHLTPDVLSLSPNIGQFTIYIL
jgi:hypothetical protein